MAQRLLLDTHVALWWWREPQRLSRAVRALIESRETEVIVSAASAIEIGIKWRIGKLPDIGDPAIHYLRLMAANGFGSLAVEQVHALRAGVMPGEHRDPFDRVIAAQALIEAVPVATVDRAFAAFGCDVVW